jgi:uncharacterized protein (TIGR02246 family)
MDEIRKLTARMNELVESGDVDSILDLMTDDVVFLVPDQLPIVGKQTYHDWVSGFQQQYSIKITVNSQELGMADEWAYEWGTLKETYTPRTSGEPFGLDGKFLRIFQKQSDGSWKIARAMWNSNVPPAK